MRAAGATRSREGATVLLAPESTITHDGTLLPLRHGAARESLARDQQSMTEGVAHARERMARIAGQARHRMEELATQAREHVPIPGDTEPVSGADAREQRDDQDPATAPDTLPG